MPSAASADVPIRGKLLITEVDDKHGALDVAVELPDGRHRPVKITRDAALTGKGIPRQGDRDDKLAGLSGATVELTAASTTSGATVSKVQVLSAATAAPPSGPVKVLTILAKFPGDKTEAVTVDEARAMVYTGTGSASDYWRASSDGLVSFTGVQRADGDVTPWLELPGANAAGCNYTTWRTLAIAQAKLAGYDFEADGYDKLNLIFNNPSGCGPLGLASFFGNTVYNFRPYVQTIAHEFGHSFGLHHAERDRCRLRNTFVGAGQTGVSCYDETDTEVVYGDHHDVLGHGFRELSAAHKTQLGFMPAANTKTWAGESTVTLRAAGTVQPAGTIQQLRIPLADGTAFHLETRRPQGTIDDYSAADPAARGVLLRHVTSVGSSVRTRLMTTSGLETNENSAWVRPGDRTSSAPIDVGRSFYDPKYDLTIEVLAHNSSSTLVQLRNGPRAGVAAQVTLVDGQLSIVDPVHRANDIVAAETGDRVTVVDHAGPLTAPAACTQVTPNQVSCPESAVTSVNADLRGGKDVFRADVANRAITALGGDGDDYLGAAASQVANFVAGNGDDVLLAAGAGSTIVCGSGTDRFDPGQTAAVFASDCESAREVSVAWEPVMSRVVADGTEAAEQLAFTGDRSEVVVTSDRPIRAGQRCVVLSTTSARCQQHGLSYLGLGRRGDDTLSNRGTAVSVLQGYDGDDVLSGGDARDVLEGLGGNDTATYAHRTAPIRLRPEYSSLTGGAIGTTERDRVDVERIIGTSGDDEIIAGAGNQTLEGGPGKDVLDGGPGVDLLRGGDGDDGLLARDGEGDTLECGNGSDRTLSEALDTRSIDCEIEPVVYVRVTNGVLEATTAAGLNTSLSLGEASATHWRLISSASQLIIAGAGCTRTSNNGVICEKQGVTSARLDGGDGNDTLRNSTTLPSTLIGGDGADAITSRNGGDDIVTCGSGTDTLTADLLPLDASVTGCETVNRA